MRASLRALHDFGLQRVLILRYEELVADPATTLGRLTDWLDLPYDDAMLDVPIVQSSYAIAEHGISQAPLERWREKLSPTEISAVQGCCGRTMRQLGYSRERVSAPLHRLVWTWASAPLAVVRAALANRKRLGRISDYVLKRLLLAFGR
jgi:hypothetical protein